MNDSDNNPLQYLTNSNESIANSNNELVDWQLGTESLADRMRDYSRINAIMTYEQLTPQEIIERHSEYLNENQIAMLNTMIATGLNYEQTLDHMQLRNTLNQGFQEQLVNDQVTYHINENGLTTITTPENRAFEQRYIAGTDMVDNGTRPSIQMLEEVPPSTIEAYRAAYIDTQNQPLDFNNQWISPQIWNTYNGPNTIPSNLQHGQGIREAISNPDWNTAREYQLPPMSEEGARRFQEAIRHYARNYQSNNRSGRIYRQPLTPSDRFGGYPVTPDGVQVPINEENPSLVIKDSDLVTDEEGNKYKWVNGELVAV